MTLIESYHSAVSGRNQNGKDISPHNESRD